MNTNQIVVINVTHDQLEMTLEWLGDLWAGHTVEGSDDGARYMKNIAQWIFLS
jgi:hypothetical protein